MGTKWTVYTLLGKGTCIQRSVSLKVYISLKKNKKLWLGEYECQKSYVHMHLGQFYFPNYVKYLVG